MRRPKLVKVTAGGGCRMTPGSGLVEPVAAIASTAKRGPERPGLAWLSGGVEVRVMLVSLADIR